MLGRLPACFIYKARETGNTFSLYRQFYLLISSRIKSVISIRGKSPVLFNRMMRLFLTAHLDEQF
jgi:hypothetical protein